jgi:protein-S-isoprenylcysteine O-methyltransferase Ste14
MYGVFLTAAWLVGILYATIPSFWLMAHPFAAKWRARRSSPYLLLLPAWLLIIVALAALTWRWNHVTLYCSLPAFIVGLTLVILGLVIYPQCFRGFTRAQLVGRPELEGRGEQQLVTSGIRSVVRHPIYLAGLCELLGWTIASGLAVLYGLLAFALVTGALMLRLEEHELEQRFGDAYREYKRTVYAILPRLSGFYFHYSKAPRQ